MPSTPNLKKGGQKDRLKQQAASKVAKGKVGGGAAAMSARQQNSRLDAMPHCKLCGPHMQVPSAQHMKIHYDAKHPREAFDMEAMTAVFAKAKADKADAKFELRGGDKGKVKKKKTAGDVVARGSRTSKGNTDQLPTELLAAMAGIVTPSMRAHMSKKK
jgi:hypothetical protein